MNAEKLEALNGSIAKWEAIIAGTGEDKGCLNCPLCKLFNTPEMISAEKCVGCPVMARTGKSHCVGTPYTAYKEAEDEDEDIETLKDLAERELEFLRSLLPKEGLTSA